MNLSSINLLSHLFPDHVSSKMDFSKALNRLVGHIMKLSQGKANPQTARQTLMDLLG